MRTGKDCFKAGSRLRAALLTSSALALAWALPASPSRAASNGTWLTSPGSNDYSNGANWDGGFVPVGTASFGTSNTTSLVITSASSVGGWTFNAGASNYTFDAGGQLNFTGAGITVNGGGVTINYNNGMSSSFTGSSTAGDATLNINYLADLVFSGNSTAGNAAINNNSQIEFTTTGPVTAGSISGSGYFDLGGNQLTVGSNNLSTEVTGAIFNGSLVKIGSGTLTLLGAKTYAGGTTINGGTLQLGSAGGGGAILGSVTVGVGGTFSVFNGDTSGITGITNDGTTIFHNGSSAGSATITNSGTLSFYDDGTAGASTITNTGHGTVDFYDRSTAGNATINHSPTDYTAAVTFHNSSTAGTANITNDGAGSVYFRDASTAASATINNNLNRTMAFYDASTAGSATINNYGGLTYFYGTSTAGGATITNFSYGQLSFNDSTSAANANITSGHYGFVGFFNSSTAGSATININDFTGMLTFHGASTAGSATITSTGNTIFYDTSTAGSATINNNSMLSFYGSSTAGTAVITNTNSVTFNQMSSAASAGITNNGVLSFSGSSTAASAAITNNLATNFAGASTAASASITNTYNILFSGNSTAGNAVITNNGGGPFHNSVGNTSFMDNSTAGNAQLINNDPSAVFDFSRSSGPNGDHKLSAGSIAGNGTFYLGDNELTVGGNNLSTAVSGVIADGGSTSGTGASLVKSGTGTLTLSGANTYTGGTTFAGGTVSVSSDANLGDAAGSLTFKGGTLQVTGTTFNTTARTVVLGVGGGTLDIADATNNFVVSQSISGSTLTKTGAGTLTMTGAAGFSGATVSAGTLAFLNASAGSADITNNAQLAFYGNSTAGNAIINNSGNVLFDGNSTAGSAQLINTASSAVINFFTPGPSSDGRISAGSIAGSGHFNLNGGELTVGGNNLSTNVTGVLTGDGHNTGTSLVKVGAGTLTLSGINTYTGATIVNGGTLSVNGSLGSSSGITVNSGGTLSGTGTVGNTTIASGGTLAPGNSIGTLSVSGNLAFSAGSFYRVEVSTTAADRTNVSGTATLTGATVQAVAIPGSFRSQTYTILNATGGLGGTQFAGLSVSGSFSPARNPHLTYDPNNVYLVLDPGAIVLPAGTGANQSNVAGAINGAVAGGGTPPAGFDALLNMGQPQLNHGLSQVSGQPGAAGTQASFNAMQQFVGMLDPLGGGADGERGGTAGDGGTLGYASTQPNDARVREAYAAVTPRAASGEVIDRRWGVWASAYGGASTLNGNTASGSSTTTSRIYGTVVGADYRLSPNTLLGFALGGAGYNFALSDSLGSGRADLFQAGFYARHNFGPAYLSAALAYGWQDVTTDRTVTVSGTDKLTANFKASTFSGRLEAGWRFAPIPASSFGVTPYAAVQVTTFHVPGYGETAIVGSNQFALSYTAQDTTNVRTELGARTDQRFLVSDGVLTLRGRLAWAHDTNTNRLVSAAFQTLPGAAFTVNGAQPAADSALVGGRAEMKWRNGLSLAGTIEGEFSQSTQTYTGKGTVRYEW
ncbi:autotransporter outer membrane beta-barrel domain-containing protein [Bradyrhizobium sp. CCBAU 51745]|uniref:autotransporter outer membrane beta-barrel domain-containing protein n=1 Tax=Bradyrhizobium sp. CCBAU 51745 TaxID=1325099 RepID=UPI002305C106|nr:autotransporter domain-containing protein [Bradyrhizobium sp. CCBAU 51745]